MTFVISAFPACGKSYCFSHYQDTWKMLDSDSSNFSWIKDENGNNTKVRNPEFPSNYIKHIKDNIGKVDFIFVSSHEVVRKALRESNIRTIMVYPKKEMKDEWVKRFKERGNDEKFIEFISSNWPDFIDDMENEDGKHIMMKNELGNTNPYIDYKLLSVLTDNSMGNLCCLWAN